VEGGFGVRGQTLPSIGSFSSSYPGVPTPQQQRQVVGGKDAYNYATPGAVIHHPGVASEGGGWMIGGLGGGTPGLGTYSCRLTSRRRCTVSAHPAAASSSY
jgi:hypothetical protein